MNIPDEAEKRYPRRASFDGEAEKRAVQRGAFGAGAQWAYDEALREAFEAVATPEGWMTPVATIQALRQADTDE